MNDTTAWSGNTWARKGDNCLYSKPLWGSNEKSFPAWLMWCSGWALIATRFIFLSGHNSGCRRQLMNVSLMFPSFQSQTFLKKFYWFQSEGNISDENHWLPASYMPPTGDWALKPGTCALDLNWTWDPLVCRPMLYPTEPNQLGQCLANLVNSQISTVQPLKFLFESQIFLN